MSPPENWAVITPMANEASEFEPFIAVLTSVLDGVGSGRVYLVIDKVSQDNTRQLCDALAARDPRGNRVTKRTRISYFRRGTA